MNFCSTYYNHEQRFYAIDGGKKMINWLLNTEMISSVLYGSVSGVSFNMFSKLQVVAAFAVGIIMSFGTLIIAG